MTKQEEITKIPLKIKKREKDPTKVAAGRKLAECNRKAKEALTREQQRESQSQSQKKESWLPELSITTVTSILDLGLILEDGFYRYKKPGYKGLDPSQNKKIKKMNINQEHQ